MSIFSYTIPITKIKSSTFQQQLSVLFPNAWIRSIEVKDHYTKVFQKALKQSLDYSNTNAGTFNHYDYLSHTDFSKPTVLVTKG